MNTAKQRKNWLFHPIAILSTLAVLNAANRLRDKSQHQISPSKDLVPETDTGVHPKYE